MEFRHDSWLDEGVLRRLEAANVSIVSGDADNQDLLREVSADFVYVRMRRDAYTEPELDDWHGWFQEQGKAKRVVFAYFKHDETGVSPEQAIGLIGGLVGGPG